MKKLALIGSKAYALGIIENMKQIGSHEIVGLIDDFEERGTIVEGLPILGNVSECIGLYKKGVFDCVFIAIGYSSFEGREKIYNSLKGKIPFANIISKTAYIHPTVKLGEGIILSDGAYVGRDATIEDNVAITLKSIVNHGCTIKKHTFFSTNVTTAGNVTIGEKCFIGVGCVLSDGITICDNTWLSPGLTIIKSIKKPGHYLSSSYKLVKID